LSDEHYAYWHRIETGYILKINSAIKNKCQAESSSSNSNVIIEKSKLIAHYKQVLETILRLHDKAKENLSEYMELCNTENFDVLDNEFLVIKTQTSFNPS